MSGSSIGCPGDLILDLFEAKTGEHRGRIIYSTFLADHTAKAVHNGESIMWLNGDFLLFLWR